jgi:hypothetical protein
VGSIRENVILLIHKEINMQLQQSAVSSSLEHLAESSAAAQRVFYTPKGFSCQFKVNWSKLNVIRLYW